MSLKGRISKIAAAMVELLKVRRIKPGNLRGDPSTLLRVATRGLLAFAIVIGATLATSHHAFASGPMLSGFNSNSLPGNDDGSTGLVPPGFSIDFFGQTYSQGYVNNNGNLTFDRKPDPYCPATVRAAYYLSLPS
jgi:hypothetical protein